MTNEERTEMLEILSPLMFESHKWCDIKQFMIENLPVEVSAYILRDLGKYSKIKHRYPPKSDVYYFVRYSVKLQKITVSRDLERSPRTEKEIKFNNTGK